MNEYFKDAYGLGARLNNNEVIYKGLKFFSDGRILKTDTDFYRPLEDVYVKKFNELPFKKAINYYLARKYKRLLVSLEITIKNEITGDRNHRKLQALKTNRENLINKYNDVTRKT